jgi:hypothetical protein
MYWHVLYESTWQYMPTYSRFLEVLYDRAWQDMYSCASNLKLDFKLKIWTVQVSNFKFQVPEDVRLTMKVIDGRQAEEWGCSESVMWRPEADLASIHLNDWNETWKLNGWNGTWNVKVKMEVETWNGFVIWIEVSNWTLLSFFFCSSDILYNMISLQLFSPIWPCLTLRVPAGVILFRSVVYI